jgi:DNA-directed RNA polymerase
MLLDDSRFYGTHAGNVDVLFNTLREAFVQMYSEDLLEKFRQEVISYLPEKYAAMVRLSPSSGLWMFGW